MGVRTTDPFTTMKKNPRETTPKTKTAFTHPPMKAVLFWKVEPKSKICASKSEMTPPCHTQWVGMMCRGVDKRV